MNDEDDGSLDGYGLVYATGYISGFAAFPLPQASQVFWAAATGVHTQGANWLAADGHVKWLRPGVVSSGMNGTIGQGQNNAARGSACATDQLGVYNFTLTFSAT
jgi:prepilin-type processing-associated H-X9-DG protein